METRPHVLLDVSVVIQIPPELPLALAVATDSFSCPSRILDLAVTPCI